MTDPSFVEIPENAQTRPRAQTVKGHVVLLHGLALNSWMMWLLSRRLKARGYTVTSWGYWSVRQSLKQLIPEFVQRFAALKKTLPADQPLYIVGHSMGSIIARAVLAELELPTLRRVVMLSPPNAGSHVATALGPRMKWLTQLVDELSDRDDSLVNSLPTQMNVDVGVIAAEWDYVVRLDSTHLPGEVDHIVMRSRHSGMILRRPVADQVIHFLEYGTFHREDCRHCDVTSPERQ